MDTLKNKQYHSYEYESRYQNVPYFFDTLSNREVYGIGTNMRTDTSWVAHTVTQEDTLDSLALKYYANPTYWWIIAYGNNIQDPFIRLIDTFSVIKIPNFSSISFDSERA